MGLQGPVLRLVQQQGITSLDPLVDNLEQLARLEALVETSKPPLPAAGPGTPSHPLLTTPFRYPPLRHGSRFGSRQSRGLFYGSRSRGGSLVEGAYYGLLFWEGLIDPPPAPRRCFSPLPSIRWKSAPNSRPITRLSSGMTTASCIVFRTSCF